MKLICIITIKSAYSITNAMHPFPYFKFQSMIIIIRHKEGLQFINGKYLALKEAALSVSKLSYSDSQKLSSRMF